jgi:CRP/FNR family cyclic AMP-dependent transcriptional regulator
MQSLEGTLLLTHLGRQRVFLLRCETLTLVSMILLLAIMIVSVLCLRMRGEVLSGNEERGMPLIPDSAVFQRRLGTLPLATYQAGENVLTAGSKTGQLLILKKGAVSISKEAIEIARVAEPGAVFGELSALLDQPHTADVRALESSEFYVADAAALLQDPTVHLYVSTILARRLVRANQALVELKSQIHAVQLPSEIGKTVQKIEQLLGPSGASLVYAGYPYDPYA